MIADHHGSGGVDPEADVIIRCRCCEIFRSVGYLKTCVVEDDVELCPSLVDSSAHRLHLFHVGKLCGDYIGVNAQSLHLAEHLCTVLLGTAVEHQITAQLSHFYGCEIAESAACACDECPSAFYIYHVFYLPFRVLYI